MNFLDIIYGFIGIISGLLSGGIGSYLFAKRKYVANVKATEINNTNKLIEFWQENFKIISDQNRELTTYTSHLIAQNIELQKRVITISSELHIVKAELAEIQKSNSHGKK